MLLSEQRDEDCDCGRSGVLGPGASYILLAVASMPVASLYSASIAEYSCPCSDWPCSNRISSGGGGRSMSLPTGCVVGGGGKANRLPIDSLLPGNPSSKSLGGGGRELEQAQRTVKSVHIHWQSLMRYSHVCTCIVTPLGQRGDLQHSMAMQV